MRLRCLGLLASLFVITGLNAQPASLAPKDTAGRQIALVTGSTDGLGREVALRIAAMGAHVIVHGRNAERGNAVVAEIMKDGKGTARFYAADLSSLANVRQLAQSILRDYGRINLLVNNAGVGSASIGPTPNAREVSADGHELKFAVNYLAPFLLTNMLKERIVRSAPSRVIMVASVGQQAIDFADPMLEKNYAGMRAYSQSKLADIMFAFDLAEELKAKNVRVYALHPATYMNTAMVRRAGVEPRTSVAEGADAVMNLVTSDLETGQYFNGKVPAQANAQAYDMNAREKLRTLSKLLTGLN